MFKVLRQKLTKDGDNGIFQGDKKTPHGVKKLEKELQKRYANGVNYNMKIIVRGDRNVGKSALFNRLQGKPFNEKYVATEEIQVTNIEWNYKNTDHIVKVEVWDVVDEGKKRKVVSEDTPSGLKICNNSTFDTIACDASVIDVYKNTHGVIFVFDITKNWTWQYVQRELSKIDKNIPVLVMANKSDLESERVIENETCEYFLKELGRNNVLFTTSSMKTAHGLRFLHSFFNLPFLHLQKDVLEKSLKQNQHEIALTYLELNSFYKESKEEQVSDDDDFGNNHCQVDNNNITNESVNKSNEKFIVKEIVSSDDDDELEGNTMVDMYEDDFDSADDFNQTLKVPIEIPKPKNWDNSIDLIETSTISQNHDSTLSNEDLYRKKNNHSESKLNVRNQTIKTCKKDKIKTTKKKSISPPEISDFEIDIKEECNINEKPIKYNDISNKVQSTNGTSLKILELFTSDEDKLTSSINADRRKKSKKNKKEKKTKCQNNGNTHNKAEKGVFKLNKTKQEDLLTEDFTTPINNDIYKEYDPI
uniref:Rab GTPase n=1 Tax=Strongyloides papillosus TaxID=174720 RepID=A0A0N5BQP0_STREA